MEHTTFAKKTVVLAALGALSLMAATVRAENETDTPSTPDTEVINVTVGGANKQDVASKIEGDVKWDQAWFDDVNTGDRTFGGVTVVKGDNADTITVTDKGSLTINLPTSESDDKFVTFQGTGLTVGKGGVFRNSSYVKFSEGGSLTVTDADFTNGEKGVIELCILSSLRKRDMYGYELSEYISDKIDISDGTVYPILRKLKSDGLVKTYLSEESGGPPRKYYSLTQTGAETFSRDAEEWLSFTETVNKMLKGEE